MLQKEFEDRTGMTVTAEEYSKIEKLYMQAGQMDKDTFCEEYKKVAKSKLVEELQTSLRISEGKVRTAKMQLEAAAARENDMADFLIEQAEKWAATDLRAKAIEMLGSAEYLRRKIEKGFNLWEVDRELLISVLSNK